MPDIFNPVTQEITFNFAPEKLSERYVEVKVLEDPDSVCIEKTYCRGIYTPDEMAEIASQLSPDEKTNITIVERNFKRSYLYDYYERSISVPFAAMARLGWPKFEAMFGADLCKETLRSFQKSFRNLVFPQSHSKQKKDHKAADQNNQIREPKGDYLLITTDGYNLSDYAFFDTYQDARIAMNEAYERCTPDEWDESDKEMSYLTGENALLYANGDHIYVWQIIALIKGCSNAPLLSSRNELVSYVLAEYYRFDTELNSLFFDVTVKMPEYEILAAYKELQKIINGDDVIREENGRECNSFIPDGMYRDIYTGNCKDFLESFNGRESETGFSRYDNDERLDFIF